VAEVGGIDSARRYEREHHPNVLLLDLNMLGGPGLEAIPKLRAEAPDTQIVVLTMHEEPAFVAGGAAGGGAWVRAEGGIGHRAGPVDTRCRGRGGLPQPAPGRAAHNRPPANQQLGLKVRAPRLSAACCRVYCSTLR
jgi:two-component system response regulator NreC